MTYYIDDLKPGMSESFTKTVTARWPSGIKEGAEFVIPTMK